MGDTVHAKAARAAGYNIIPLSGKVPAIPTWSEFQVKRYEGEIKGNYGIICGEISGNLMVIDIDDPKLYDRFKKYHGRTFTVRTGGGGYHLYFKLSIACPSGDLHDPDRNKIEIKGNGKYVVGPGCVHPDTEKKYEVICEKPPLEISIKQNLAMLVAAGFDPKPRRRPATEDGVEEGERNENGFRLAIKYCRRDGLFGTALDHVMDEWNSKNTRPLGELELRNLTRSAERYIITKKGELRLDDLERVEQIVEKIKPGEDVDMMKFADIFHAVPPAVISRYVSEKTDGRQFYGEQASLSEVIAESRSSVPRDYRGTVIGTGKLRTYTRSADYTCPKCEQADKVECDTDYRIEIPKCPEHGITMRVDKETRVVGFIRRIIIQQLVEDSDGEHQAEFEAEIMDDAARNITIGDRREFTMIFRSMEQKDGFNDVLFQVISTRGLIEDVKKMPDEKQVAAWRADPEIYGKFLASVAPDLYIQQEVVESVLYAVRGGISIKGKRRNIHVGLMGDVGLGKSDLMKRLERIYEGSKYTVGTQTSRVGLAGGLQDTLDKVKVPRLGLLALYNKSALYVDEADKMDDDDKNAVLSSMEQGETYINKGGFNITAPADTTVVVIGNPKYLKYKPEKSIVENTDLPAAMISRFDLLWLMTDTKNKNVDKAIYDLLTDEKSKPPMDLDTVRMYINYARSLDVSVPKKVKDQLFITYNSLRDGDLGVEVGTRQMLGLMRMVAANAALHLRTVATAADVEDVRRVVRASYASRPGDPLIDDKRRIDVALDKAWEAVQDENGTIAEDDLRLELEKGGVSGDEFSKVRWGLGYERMDDGRWRRVAKGGV